MNKIKHLLILALSLFVLGACTDDDGKNPTFGDDELYLHGEWSPYLARKIGTTLVVSGLQVSPADAGATYQWILGDEVISTEKDLSFKLDKEYLGVPLKFVVTKPNGISSFRVANLLAAKDFVPKDVPVKTIGFLTKDAKISDIDWASVTHLVYSGIKISKNEEGKVQYQVFDDIDMATLIAFAHHYGVYVQLQVTGSLASDLACIATYADFTFYEQILADPEGLATKIVKEAKDRNFDGVNILMDKANGTANGWFEDNVTQKKFYDSVAKQLKEEKNTIDDVEYDYLASMTAWGGWTRVSIYPFVKNTDFDWINVLAFGNENTKPQEHAGNWFTENEITQWMTSWIGPIPANRLVLVTPAFGLQYKGKPADFTWSNLGEHTTYKSYADICVSDATAHTKNKIFTVDYTGEIDDNKQVDVTYYDGLPAAKSKATYAKNTSLFGIGLWSVESDSKDPTKSLMKQMRTTLDE